MDVYSIFLDSFSKIWYYIPIVLIVGFFTTPIGKGIIGEFLVNSSAKIKLPKDKYHLIDNVTLSTEDSKTTQIDHIIVSEYGIFVVETKNYKGWIFGDEKQKFWTQKIYNKTNKFQNPLHQNYKHLKTIEKLLDIDINKLFSVIVFAGDSEFKTKMPKNVTKGIGYIDYIKSKKEKLLTKTQIDKIIKQIEEGRLSKSLKTNIEHINNVKAIIEEKEINKNSNNKICPWCNSKLVLREAKQGANRGSKFYGCSNFPNCKYIMPM
jgi:hypothetical protein